MSYTWEQRAQYMQDERDSLKGALAAAEGERIALADAWRAQMEGMGVPKVTAALIVQGVIDNAEPKS